MTVAEVDRTKEALIAIKFVKLCMESSAKITTKQVTELLRGKQPKKSVYARGSEQYQEEYKGKLKHMKENDIKRMIVQLLIMRVFKERFEMQTVRGTTVKNVYVFLQISQSRQNLVKAIENGKLPVLLSEGVKKGGQLQIQEDNQEQDISQVPK